MGNVSWSSCRNRALKKRGGANRNYPPPLNTHTHTKSLVLLHSFFSFRINLLKRKIEKERVVEPRTSSNLFSSRFCDVNQFGLVLASVEQQNIFVGVLFEIKRWISLQLYRERERERKWKLIRWLSWFSPTDRLVVVCGGELSIGGQPWRSIWLRGPRREKLNVVRLLGHHPSSLTSATDR